MVSARALTGRGRFFDPLSICGVDVVFLLLLILLGRLSSTSFLRLLPSLLGSHLESPVLLTPLALLPELVACVSLLVGIESLFWRPL